MNLRFSPLSPVLFITATLSVLLPLSGFVQDAGVDSVLTTEEQRVLAAEDEYVAAEVNRDEAVMRRLVDERFVFNHSDGTTSGKEELIADVMKMSMTGQTLSERSVIVEGDVALIFGTAELRFGRPDTEESTATFRYTSSYVKREGQWRFLALQMQKRVTK